MWAFPVRSRGFWEGRALAETALEEGWDIIAVLNNDMIGNTVGDDGIKDNTTFRVFSEPNPCTDELGDYQRRRTRGGEVDGPSRQIARYVDRIADLYFPNLDAKMIYRLDRFGRGGHHRPFNDVGFPGVRIMETHESYIRQHQDIRVEDGIEYGDVVEWVDFDYTAKMTALNAAVLASMAWAPPAPTNVQHRWIEPALSRSLLGAVRRSESGWIQGLLAGHHGSPVGALPVGGQGGHATRWRT